MVDLAVEVLGGDAARKKVGVWGAAFKPNSDDIRDSPALEVANTLQSLDAVVTVYDPKALDNAHKKFPQLNYCHSATDAVDGANLILHLTEWDEFQELDPRTLDGVVGTKCIVDGRSALDPRRWRSAGWTFRALGRP